MIFLSILILIVAVALSSIKEQLTPVDSTRLTSITFIYALSISLNALYIQSIGSGIGLYSWLFHLLLVLIVIYKHKKLINFYSTVVFFWFRHRLIQIKQNFKLISRSVVNFFSLTWLRFPFDVMNLKRDNYTVPKFKIIYFLKLIFAFIWATILKIVICFIQIIY